MDKILLSDVFFVDKTYAQKHAHMLHRHDCILELLYVADGESRYTVGGREYTVRTGDMVICNAGTIHGEIPFQIHSMQTYCCAFSGVRVGDLPPGCLIPEDACPVLDLRMYKKTVGNIMPDLYKLYKSSAENIEICRSLALSVFLMTRQALSKPTLPDAVPDQPKSRELVGRITAYLDHNYREPVSLEQIARQFHISPSHLSHLFKRETGYSPTQYLIHRRIGEAQSLLMETRLPIRQIVERLGFGSNCHLNALFKKYVGVSPREYRNHFSDISAPD